MGVLTDVVDGAADVVDGVDGVDGVDAVDAVDATADVSINTTADASAPEPAPASLKYQLLGPSLTKAGQESVDQSKVSEIIYQASKGSKFFRHEESKDRSLTAKIERLLAQRAALEQPARAGRLAAQRKRADAYLAALERGRDLSQTVVHVDCDAFYAAVKELDRPELAAVPMAVGAGVLTTCNYHARKFGCRSGMAAFVARRLCPHLVIVPLNIAKYAAKAAEVRRVLARYDADFESAGLDEAYLNITGYCEGYALQHGRALTGDESGQDDQDGQDGQDDQDDGAHDDDKDHGDDNHRDDDNHQDDQDDNEHDDDNDPDDDGIHDDDNDYGDDGIHDDGIHDDGVHDDEHDNDDGAAAAVAAAVVSQLRAQVRACTGLTVSAGIAANATLAKIASNVNKPDGQFQLARHRPAILRFMHAVPTRRVNGIGRVFERELAALGVRTCGDLRAARALLAPLFGDKAFCFLMHCYLGLGRTVVRPAAPHDRKSVGTEATFRDTSDPLALRATLRRLAAELQRDLARARAPAGRTLLLKVKLHTYQLHTRQTALPRPLHLADDLYRHAVPMLAKLALDLPGMTLRLMGLRLSQLIATAPPPAADFFGVWSCPSGGPEGSAGAADGDADGGTWQVWPEAEFADAARRERQHDMDELEALSQEHEKHQQHEQHEHNEQHEQQHEQHEHEYEHHEQQREQHREHHEHEHHEHEHYERAPPAEAQGQTGTQTWACPICSHPQAACHRTFNEHVDLCLSRSAIREAVRDGDGHPLHNRPTTADRPKHSRNVITTKHGQARRPESTLRLKRRKT